MLVYLGRYTHRVAISNSRLVSMENGKVAFRWKDYRHHAKPKLMTLEADEFIRRFLLHTLPDGFHRIRHYGFLANGHRDEKLALCRRLLGERSPEPHAEQMQDSLQPRTRALPLLWRRYDRARHLAPPDASSPAFLG